MELKLSQEFLTENDCYQAGGGRGGGGEPLEWGGG